MISLILIVLTSIFVYLWSQFNHKKRPPLPPGPPADPLLGHLRHIPPEGQESLFYRWGKVYGDIIHLHFLGRSVVVLNSVEAAVDLLERRSSNYSDRPTFYIYELMGWMRTLTFLRYGKTFQVHRKMFQSYLNVKKTMTYRPIETRESRVLLQSLVANDEEREGYIRRFSTAIVIRLAYGHLITSNEDPYMKITEDTSNAVSNAGPPGSTLVDFFPFLQYFPSWFPGTYYATFARENKFVIDKLHDIPFIKVQEEMVQGKAKPSFLTYQLENLSLGYEPVNALSDIKGAAGVMYCAGAESTWATMSFFFLAMVLYPECQTRAQNEIDKFVGSGRLPEFEDRDSLTYVEGILWEALRWQPVVPTGIPHRSLEDDVYRGMFIPKGSLIIANTRGMTLDDRVYTNPHTFDPARYLPKPEGRNEPPPSGPFGFGRRVCPGRHLAEDSLWIAIASILATMNITKAIGTDGKEITPELTFTCGIVSQPRPYKCRIQPRNEVARALIAQADTWDGY